MRVTQAREAAEKAAAEEEARKDHERRRIEREAQKQREAAAKKKELTLRRAEKAAEKDKSLKQAARKTNVATAKGRQKGPQTKLMKVQTWMEQNKSIAAVVAAVVLVAFIVMASVQTA